MQDVPQKEFCRPSSPAAAAAQFPSAHHNKYQHSIMHARAQPGRVLVSVRLFLSVFLAGRVQGDDGFVGGGGKEQPLGMEGQRLDLAQALAQKALVVAQGVERGDGWVAGAGRRVRAGAICEEFGQFAKFNVLIGGCTTRG